MKDTSKKALKKQREIIHSKTPEERAEMGIEMMELGYELTRRTILREHPDLNEKEIAAEIFLRYYGNEFSEEEKERITKSIKSS